MALLATAAIIAAVGVNRSNENTPDPGHLDNFDTPGDSATTETLSGMIGADSSKPLSSEPQSEPVDKQNFRQCIASDIWSTDHPIINEERSRLAALLVDTPELSAYRGQSISNLEQLAGSGDSLAMLAVALHEIHAAVGGAQIDPIDLVSDDGVTIPTLPETLSSQQKDKLDRASRWLYEAALNGRIFSMLALQELEEKRFGSIFERNEISQSDIEKTGISQSGLTTMVKWEILAESEPELRNSLLGLQIENIWPILLDTDVETVLQRHPELQSLIDTQVNILRSDRNAAGLAAQQIADPIIPLEDAYQEVCQSR